jgi:hypothetical protein
MERKNLPEKFQNREPAHQREVEEMVDGLIASRGYHSVIYDLVAAVYNLAEIYVADPQNGTKMRHFGMWATAVRAAILEHDGANTFEQSISNFDRLMAHRMGIKLD